jgi:hypothetical protein
MIRNFKSFNESRSESYPTMEEVEKASHRQICYWNRFLDSPGTRAIGKDNFEKIMEEEGKIMDRIVQRLKEFGGFTPEISKSLGWR